MARIDGAGSFAGSAAAIAAFGYDGLMRSRFALLSLLVFVSLPLSAQFYRGEVHFVTSAEYWVAVPDFPTAAICCGDIGVYKNVPYWRGHFFITPQNGVVFHDGHTTSFWDGEPVFVSDPRQPWSDIFSDDAKLTEIAPMRSGHFLVASAPGERGAKLIEFDLQRKIAEYPFEGAEHIELLSDQCTLLYTNGDRHVRRFDVCTQQQMSDFAELLPGETAGSVQQMPNGNVLVAGGTGVVVYQADGSFWTYYPFAGVTHLVLTSYGMTFYAASSAPELRFFTSDPGWYASIQLGYAGAPKQPVVIRDLVSAGEWRASAVVARSRGVRRR